MNLVNNKFRYYQTALSKIVKLNKQAPKIDELSKQEIDDYISDNKTLRDVFFAWIDVTQENLSKVLNKQMSHATSKTKSR